MIDYGTAPAPDEIELTVFGPGYGEAITVHLGDGNWLLVDSCIDPHSNQPASATYLDQLGVSPSQVRAIVSSHWHDDHVRGISLLANKYPDAEFFLSAAFSDKEALAFVTAYSGADAPGLARGTSELFNVVESRDSVYQAAHRTSLLDLQTNQGNVHVTAWSPTNGALARSLANFVQYLPKSDLDPITHAPKPKENLESVVIHVDFRGEEAILLGADLENHAIGWGELAGSAWCNRRTQSSAYKVAHHGSSTGDHDAIWSNFLGAQRIACLTPYNRSKLPTDTDRARIRSLSSEAYISSGSSRKADMSRDQIKRLGDICTDIELADAGFGAIRLRKKIGAQDWSVELFGRAESL